MEKANMTPVEKNDIETQHQPEQWTQTDLFAEIEVEENIAVDLPQNEVPEIPQYRAIDFFCGGGGMTCGLRQAGIEVVAGVDFDEDARDTYELNNPNATFVLTDIKELPENYFENNFDITPNDDHLILVGCSPCQYYTRMNTNKKKSISSKDLLEDFSRFIGYYNPGYILVENVPGLQSSKDSVLPKFLEFLNNHGYRFLDKKVSDLSYYGVPQSRKRFSLIASRIREVSLPVKEDQQLSLRSAIGEGFPTIEAGHTDNTDFNHTTAGLAEINLLRLRSTSHNGGSRLEWKDNPLLQVPCYIGKDNAFRDVYGRMCWERPSSTITTKFTSISNGRFGHPEQDRAISIREGATIQTFPIDYVFNTTSIAAAAKLIGNAVPPEYARRLGLSIINL